MIRRVLARLRPQPSPVQAERERLAALILQTKRQSRHERRAQAITHGILRRGGATWPLWVEGDADDDDLDRADERQGRSDPQLAGWRQPYNLERGRRGAP